MTVDVESLAEEVRKIAGRPTIGQLARGFLLTAADGLVQLEAENARLRALLENTAHSGLDLLSEMEYLDTKGHFEECCKALEALKGKEAAK